MESLGKPTSLHGDVGTLHLFLDSCLSVWWCSLFSSHFPPLPDSPEVGGGATNWGSATPIWGLAALSAVHIKALSVQTVASQNAQGEILKSLHHNVPHHLFPPSSLCTEAGEEMCLKAFKSIPFII